MTGPVLAAESTVSPPAPGWLAYDSSGLDVVLESALSVIAAKGYGAARVRDIADGAGLSVAGLYHHYSSKQQILATLLTRVLDDLRRRCEAAYGSVTDPCDRFDAVAECLLRFHMVRRREAFVASSELRSLDAAHRLAVVALRDQIQALLTSTVVAGCSEGVFATPHPADAARAIATVCVGVASWYSEDGPLSPEQITRRQLRLLHALLGDM